MEPISVFDMIKIGIGPSSSHTMGPWIAAKTFIEALNKEFPLSELLEIQVHLFGSLAKTGKGHGTDVAIIMGLTGADYAKIDKDQVFQTIKSIHQQAHLTILETHTIPFKPSDRILFHFEENLPFHPNGMTFRAYFKNQEIIAETYYSIGGGFITQEESYPEPLRDPVKLPFPINSASDWKKHCDQEEKESWEIILANEKKWNDGETIKKRLLALWNVMKEAIYRGCHKEGTLEGGLQVRRRAFLMHRKLFPSLSYQSTEEWMARISTTTSEFRNTLKWVSCFAIAVSEENASFGKIVTAPTNGASGVIPAVLMYFACFCEEYTEEQIEIFLLVAGEIGSLFKKGATISAAMGGCQAEIGVSSAMAAGGLCAALGGNIDQILMAAEITMEHHLGLTCDPIRGLVQIPCIERNSMGAVKAITACNIALETDPLNARVSLDGVIKSMWETAKDMSTKYKETSEGGLAVHIPVNVSEC